MLISKIKIFWFWPRPSKYFGRLCVYKQLTILEKIGVTKFQAVQLPYSAFKIRLPSN
jgi:hypothetical protein